MEIHEHDRSLTLRPFRMVQWLGIALALYFIVFDPWIGLQDSNPGLQTTIYNLAGITIRAYLGYWISRAVIGRLRLDGSDDPLCLVARSIIIGCVVLTSK